MQTLHHKQYVGLVQILQCNCSETYCSFCENLPPIGRTPHSTCMWVLPSDLFSPHYIFAPLPLKLYIRNVITIIFLIM